MIAYVDDLFGRQMQALDDSGFADNTVVPFASDHGDMSAERSMWFRKALFNPAVQAPPRHRTSAPRVSLRDGDRKLTLSRPLGQIFTTSSPTRSSRPTLREPAIRTRRG